MQRACSPHPCISYTIYAETTALTHFLTVIDRRTHKYNKHSTKCVAGQHQSEIGAVSCDDCPANRYSDRAAQANCSTCSLGKQAQRGSAQCLPCVPGKAGSMCAECAAGQFRGQNDSPVACIACAPGRMSGSGSAACALSIDITPSPSDNNTIMNKTIAAQRCSCEVGAGGAAIATAHGIGIGAAVAVVACSALWLACRVCRRPSKPQPQKKQDHTATSGVRGIPPPVAVVPVVSEENPTAVRAREAWQPPRETEIRNTF